MGNIDGYRLLGIKPGDGELYDLGWIQIDRDELLIESRRERALIELQGFATGRTFNDGEYASDLRYVWGHTFDLRTSKETRFKVPIAVNRELSDNAAIALLPDAPNEPVVNQFTRLATEIVSRPAVVEV